MNAGMRWLGYAGLIPFVLLALFPAAITPYASQPVIVLFLTYSMIILSFMAGVLWPVFYRQQRPLPLALAAVTAPVISFLAAATLTVESLLLLQAVLFIGLRLFEVLAGIDAEYSPAYRSLRWQLTGVVVLCHLWLWW